MKMRSYEAARGYFSFLAFISWCIIIVGAIAAIGAMVAASEMSRGYGGSPMAGVIGLIPGIAIMFAGFMGLVLVQIGRAGVDSAEYAQQSLKIAREQLDISRQSMSGGRVASSSFATAAGKDASEPAGPSFAGMASTEDTGHDPALADTENDETANTLAPPETAAIKQTLNFQGQQLVEYEDGTYSLGERTFADLDSVKNHIRVQAVRSNVVAR